MRAELREEKGNVAKELSLADVSIPIREEHSPHPVARGIEDERARAVRRIASRYPGVRVLPSGTREYAYQNVTVTLPTDTLPAPLREELPESIEVDVEGPLTHIVGWMRKVYAEDMDRRPRVNPRTGEVDPGHYMPGDLIGRSGVEASQEYRLRGDRGRVVRHLDTEKEDVSDPVAGSDVQITIDAALQARIASIMDPSVGLARVQPWHTRIGQAHPLPIGTPLYGAATVIEVDTGEILAMVSTPSFDLERIREEPETVWDDPVTQRGMNKAIAKPYPPGSIVKPHRPRQRGERGRARAERGHRVHGPPDPEQQVHAPLLDLQADGQHGHAPRRLRSRVARAGGGRRLVQHLFLHARAHDGRRSSR